ncbi:MAG: hypothetical protein K9L28_02440 [Synergistales bacterium]|nr:hypothetical protein [Synergistales bacterium]
MHHVRSGITAILALFCVTLLFGTAFAADAPTIKVDPPEGTPGTKLVFTGTGFNAGEKVRVIMDVGDVNYSFGEAGTGGIVEADSDGSFVLEPRGGIPKVYIDPGTYTITAVGEQGSKATTSLTVLPKE